MNRTIRTSSRRDEAVKRFYYADHDELHQHLADFVAAYNFAKRLKTLRGLTPYEAICKAWHDNPSTFSRNPIHQTHGIKHLARPMR